MGNLILEFESCDTNDAIITPATYTGAYATVSTVANCSNEWSISNACVKCDVVSLDNALNNSYVEHLLSGKSLPINYSTYISQQNSILNTGAFKLSVRFLDYKGVLFHSIILTQLDHIINQLSHFIILMLKMLELIILITRFNFSCN